MADFNSTLTSFVAVAEAEAARPAAVPGHHPTACLNCGTALTDHFCPHCGQPAATHRFTLKHLLLHDLPHSVWHVDKGLVYTFKEMLTRPGLTIREYLAGKRARHFRPISYLLLLTGLSVLLMSSLHLDMFAGKTQAEAPEMMRLVMQRYMQFNFKYPALIQLVMIPLNALAAWAFMRRAGYNYAEMLMAGAFISGTLTVIALVFNLPFILSGGRALWLSQAVMVPLLLYPLWVNAQLLKARPGLSTAARYGRALGVALLQIVNLFIYVFVCIITITVLVAREHPELAKNLKPKTQVAAPATPQPAR